MKVSELIKILKKNNCYLLRHGKRHDMWYSETTKKQFPVSRHLSQDVPTGTFNSIKEDAGF